MDSKGEKEGIKAKDNFVEYFHKPAFRKLFINGLNFYAMRIPTAFLDRLEKEVPKMATLCGSSGGYWQVKVVKEEEEISLEDGWEKFREDNNLFPGDVLLFRYSGNWCFEVEIFGLDGLEKKMHDFQEQGRRIRPRKNFLNLDNKMKKSQVVNRKKIANSRENDEETDHCSLQRRKRRRPSKKSMLLSPKKQGLKSQAFVPEGKSREKRKCGNQNDCVSSSTLSMSENDSELKVLELEETRRSRRKSRKPTYLKHFVES